RHSLLTRPLRQSEDRLLPHLTVHAVVYHNVLEIGRRRISSRLTKPEDRLGARAARQIGIAGNLDERRPDLRAVRDRRRENRFLPHASALRRGDRDQVTRRFPRGYCSEIDDIGPGCSPAPTHIEAQIGDLAIPPVDHATSRTHTAITLPPS